MAFQRDDRSPLATALSDLVEELGLTSWNELEVALGNKKTSHTVRRMRRDQRVGPLTARKLAGLSATTDWEQFVPAERRADRAPLRLPVPDDVVERLAHKVAAILHARGYLIPPATPLGLDPGPLETPQSEPPATPPKTDQLDDETREGHDG